MKLLKKLAGMLLAMIMVLSMSTVAFAAQGTNDNSGSITIQMITAVPLRLMMQLKDILTMHTRFWYWKATTQMLVRILTKLMTSGKSGWEARLSMYLLMRRGM